MAKHVTNQTFIGIDNQDNSFVSDVGNDTLIGGNDTNPDPNSMVDNLLWGDALFCRVLKKAETTPSLVETT